MIRLLLFSLILFCSLTSFSQNTIVSEVTEGGKVALEIVRALQEFGNTDGAKTIQDKTVCLKNSAGERISCTFYKDGVIISELIIAKGKQECSVDLEPNKYKLVCKEGELVLCKTEILMKQQGIRLKIK